MLARYEFVRMPSTWGMLREMCTRWHKESRKWRSIDIQKVGGYGNNSEDGQTVPLSPMLYQTERSQVYGEHVAGDSQTLLDG